VKRYADKESERRTWNISPCSTLSETRSWADHSPPSNVETYVSGYTSTPPIRLHGVVNVKGKVVSVLN